MSREGKMAGARGLFTILATGVLGLGLTSLAAAVDPGQEQPAVVQSQDIKKVQEGLRDRGYDTGRIDGVIGPRTRKGIREFQKAEDLPVTGDLDAETAGKLGAGPESVGGSFKGAGQEVVEGAKEAGQEIKEGKPIAAGKEMGKGLGRAGEKVGEGVGKAVSPDSARGDREEKAQPESQDNP